MGPKFFQAVAVTCASAGCILFVVALASPSWIVGCLQYENIFKALGDHPSSSEQVKSYTGLSSKILHGVSMCIHQGIFKFSMEAGSIMNIQSGIYFTSIPRYALFGSFGIIFAAASAVTGAVFLIIAASRDTYDYSEKSKASRFVRLAIILFVVGGLAGVVGMGIYSGGSNKAAHDPLLFMANFGLIVQGSDLHQMTNAFSSEFPALGGRGKRDIDIGSLGLDAQSEKYLTTMLNGLSPHYGYAFILGWVATAVLLLAAVLAATARRYFFDHPYSGAAGVKL